MEKILAKGKDWVKLTVDTKVYSLSTVYSAGYVFLDTAYLYLDKNSKGKLLVWLFPKNKKTNLDKLGMDFCNELLNYAHYNSRLKANAEAVKMLMQRALFSAAPSMVQEAEEEEIKDLIKELEQEETASGEDNK